MFLKLTNKKTVFVLIMLILISTPFANAVVLESGIPNTNLKPGTDIQDLSIAQYINYIYLFVLGVVGIAVFASLVFWGVVWISSGIADKRGMALGKIKDAFTGLAIALGAYIILNTINPDLLTLKDLSENRVKIQLQKPAMDNTIFLWANLKTGETCQQKYGSSNLISTSVAIDRCIENYKPGPYIPELDYLKATNNACCKLEKLSAPAPYQFLLDNNTIEWIQMIPPDKMTCEVLKGSEWQTKSTTDCPNYTRPVDENGYYKFDFICCAKPK